MKEYGLADHWPQEVQQAAAAISPQIPLEGRTDLRAAAFVTIDGESAADFDDAVYCEQQGADAWRLWVAIADVSHYVQPGSLLDQEAARRGNSSYLPGNVIPMLPEQLSNGLCSLRPEEERLVLVCRMDIGADGRPRSYRFLEGVMRSQMRLSYTQVEGFYQHPGSQDSLPKGVRSSLEALGRLFDRQREARRKRGSLDLELAESVVVLKDQRVAAVQPVVRGVSHRVIEECMLVANVCAADFLARAKVPTLYRVHPVPQGENVQQLRNFLEWRGLQLKGGATPEVGHFQRLVDQLQGREDVAILQGLILRAMEKACYQERNGGHFALGYPAYLHFSSPIRRYPDLVVHRTIRYLLRDAQRRNPPPYDAPALEALGEHCSTTERNSDKAEWNAQKRLKCLYLRDHVGEEHKVRVSAVTAYGLFATLEKVLIDGLIPTSTLPKERYRFDADRQCLEARRSGKRFSLGDCIDVRIDAVDPAAGKIRLVPLAGG